mmetsp:Transcript_17494/g.32792  ORF Transcript_17494/g.32792 Transcript_17494/m.32792 type:complete len:129 (-) Transcript_17494:205-591(-)|eukprot:scaffold4833_cov233-Amphora_coffeaeformis.AAC.31
MSWTRPAVSFAQGAAITLGSTAVSCALALQVEKSAHRLFFWAAPHWYAKVDQAYGLTEEDLQYARLAGQQMELQQVANLKNIVLMDHSYFASTAIDDERWTDWASKASWWNQARATTDEEMILESAPL